MGGSPTGRIPLGDMKVVRASEGLYRVDLKPGGYSNLVSAYVADAERGLLVFEGGPAVAGPELVEALRSFGKPAAHVFLTHVHIDHYGGAGAIAQLEPTARFYVNLGRWFV